MPITHKPVRVRCRLDEDSGRIERNIIGYTEGRTDVGTVREVIDAVLIRRDSAAASFYLTTVVISHRYSAASVVGPVELVR